MTRGREDARRRFGARLNVCVICVWGGVCVCVVELFDWCVFSGGG